MVVPVDELKRFVEEAMTAVGTVQEHAVQMADVLVAADYRGHYSHGLNRLGEWRLARAFRCIWFLIQVGSHCSCQWSGIGVRANRLNRNNLQNIGK